MPGQLEQALVEAFNAMKEDLRKLLLQETPFVDGVLPAAAIGTHPHDGGDITSGTVAAARLGSSPAASKLLFGDNTWAALVAGDLPTHPHAGVDITSGTVNPARLGSGTPTAATLLFGDSTWAALVAADIPNLDSAKITTGSFAAARLGSGSPSATTLLWGDSTWAALVAGDIPNLDANKITTGTMATARLGSGTANANTYLTGAGAWAGLDAADITTGTVPTARLGSGSASSTTALFGDQTYKTAIIGGGVAGQVVLYSAGTTITGDSSLTFNTGTNNLTLSSGGIGVGGAPSSQLTLSGATAQKSSGTLWDVTSDGRTKTVLGPYTDSLTFLRTLPRPIYYERNGALGTTKGERGMGFVAQEIEKVAPHWVRYTDCEDSTTKLLRLDLHEMAFAELNAILELAERGEREMSAIVERLDRIEKGH